MGRPRHLRLAGHDHTAGQGHGRGRPVSRELEGWKISKAQDPSRNARWGRALKDTFQNTVSELLAQSLVAWGLIGSVCSQSDGVIVVSCNATEIRIEPSPPDLPFHWMVTVHGRKR